MQEKKQNNSNIQRVVIVGGGTAGWMAAAGLCDVLAASRIDQITLIESPDVPSVGVGEATIPGIRNFNAHLGIDEIEFIKKTKATFKLGIRFDAWTREGDTFFHPFSNYGSPIHGVDFHQCVNTASRHVDGLSLADFSLPTEFARQGRFAQPPENISNPLADYKYAFHLDAILYAGLLREYATQRNLEHIQDLVSEVILDPESGHIKNLKLESGKVIEGDLFIDCTGFRGVLIEQAMKTGYEDWSGWLPVDRAVAVGSISDQEPAPFTVASAREAGWTWRIPLQHRYGNGYVYSSNYCSVDEAINTLLENIDEELLSEPKHFRFTAGRRKKFWNKNCIALGLAGGFLEPLESTSISLIQTGISRLLMFFPDHGFNSADIEEANRLAELEAVNIRDFLILHYCLNQRDQHPFWRDIKEITLPDSLKHKIDLYRHRGHVVQYELESFQPASWISIYNGMGVRPAYVDPRAEQLPAEQTLVYLRQMRQTILDNAAQAPKHSEFIAKHCSAAA